MQCGRVAPQRLVVQHNKDKRSVDGHARVHDQLGIAEKKIKITLGVRLRNSHGYCSNICNLRRGVSDQEDGAAKERNDR